MRTRVPWTRLLAEKAPITQTMSMSRVGSRAQSRIGRPSRRDARSVETTPISPRAAKNHLRIEKKCWSQGGSLLLGVRPMHSSRRREGPV